MHDSDPINQLAPAAPVRLARRRPTHYTPSVKFTGNAVLTASALFAIPPTLLFLFLGVFGPLQMLVTIFAASIWIMSAIEYASLWKNSSLREAAYHDLRASRPEMASRALAFVGYCSRGFLMHQCWHSDMAHEDVGILCSGPEAITFAGDHLELVIGRSAIRDIRFATNPFYRFVGVRWIRITYVEDSETRYAYFQSREKDRLSQLASCNRRLMERMRAWWKRERPALRPAVTVGE